MVFMFFAMGYYWGYGPIVFGWFIDLDRCVFG